jgi:uncharacterized protein YggT (Ycf19 family)
MSPNKLYIVAIGLFTVFTVITFFTLPRKYGISLLIIDISVIIFAFLVWLNDKHFNEQINERVFSISDKKFIQDVIVRQMNMHGITRIIEKDNTIQFYKGNKKTGEVKFKTDNTGKPLKIDGKYIIEVKAPEYILHNIDHETWSILSQK